MDKFAMIIFGASGDLTKRKLMPALYSLYRDKRLTGSFTVLGIGRTVYSDEDYRSYILGELQQFVKAEEQNLELMSSFVSHLYYLPMDPAKVEGYSQLRERLVELTKEVDPDNLLFCQRLINLHYLIPEIIRIEYRRRLHSRKSYELNQVILHHIPQSPRRLVKTSTLLNTQILYSSNLHIINIITIP